MAWPRGPGAGIARWLLCGSTKRFMCFPHCCPNCFFVVPSTCRPHPHQVSYFKRACSQRSQSIKERRLEQKPCQLQPERHWDDDG
eukprot:8557673-Pyramimonas_sp.AAC.2